MVTVAEAWRPVRAEIAVVTTGMTVESRRLVAVEMRAPAAAAMRQLDLGRGVPQAGLTIQIGRPAIGGESGWRGQQRDDRYDL